MVNICVVGSRKGGVGKSTLAYELAYKLEAVLVDFEWDGDSVSNRWGYRYEDRSRDVLVSALENGRAPRHLKGFRKPDLVPGSPNLVDVGLGANDYADMLSKWAVEWGREWVVVDTHPGASEPAHGAMSIANIVCVPTGLRTADLNGTQRMVEDMPDYPLVIVPNMIGKVPPAPEVNRLAKIVEGTPVQVGTPIPFARPVERRKKRIAITAEDPVPKALQPFATAYDELASFVREYVA